MVKTTNQISIQTIYLEFYLDNYIVESPSVEAVHKASDLPARHPNLHIIPETLHSQNT
jgi:hypothetical protein